MEASNITPDDTPPDIKEGETIKEYVQRQIAEALQGHTPPAVPKVDHAPTTNDEAMDLGRALAEYRGEIAALRAELASHRPRVVYQGQTKESLQDREAARLAQIADNPYYCPGCGNLSRYPRLCVGADPRHPTHAPIEMVSTDELGGDPAQHTRAPSTDPDFPDLVAA